MATRKNDGSSQETQIAQVLVAGKCSGRHHRDGKDRRLSNQLTSANRVRQYLVREVDKLGIEVRKNYNQIATELVKKSGRYIYARQMNRV